MTKEELQSLYRSWSDEQLLRAFTKRDDYTEVAVAAMLAVIDERQLSGGAEVLLKKDLERRQEWREEDKRRYEQQMLGEDVSACKLAAKSLNPAGEYYVKDVASRQKKTGEVFVFVLTITAFIFAIVFMFQPAPFAYAPLYPLLVGLAGTMLAIKMYRKRKAWIVLKKERNKTVLILNDHSYRFMATVPFHYFFYWERTIIRHPKMKLTHPTLSVGITNERNETILLRGQLPALADGPPDWPFHGETDFPIIPEGVLAYSERPFKGLELTRFKKILDGVHESVHEKIQ